MLNTRDYELIRISFRKIVAKIQVDDFFKISKPICHGYKKYSPAYFEEVLLDPGATIEKRVAKNYRERFLIERDAIF